MMLHGGPWENASFILSDRGGHCAGLNRGMNAVTTFRLWKDCSEVWQARKRGMRWDNLRACSRSQGKRFQTLLFVKREKKTSENRSHTDWEERGKEWFKEPGLEWGRWRRRVRISRSSSATDKVCGQPALCETLPQKPKGKKQNKTAVCGYVGIVVLTSGSGNSGTRKIGWL